MKKYFKSYILFALMALTFAGCKTDDLKDDLDDLKDRVTLLEEQVKILNDNVEVFAYVLNPDNKTIYDVVEGNGSYTIILSNGEELQLTLGSQGTVETPTIEVNDEGYWVINGVATTYKAKGDAGDNLIPEFSINSSGKWAVRYGEDATWEVVEGEYNVDAAGDQFFESAEVQGDTFVITGRKNGDKYEMPIVRGLKCVIEGDDIVEFQPGERKTFDVTIESDGKPLAPIYPEGWRAELTSQTEAGKYTLTVYAPSSTSSTLSRATANNSEEVVVRANKGVFWAVDKIKVRLPKEYTSDKDRYDDGLSITVNGFTINRDDYGLSKSLPSDGAITESGVYFITDASQSSLAVTDITLNIADGINNLIIINESSSKPTLIISSKQTLKGTFILDNVNLNQNCSDDALIVSDDVNFVINRSNITGLYVSKSLLTATENVNISLFSVYNSDIKLNDNGTSSSNLYLLSGISCKKYDFKNNIVAYNTDNTETNDLGDKAKLTNFKLFHNNTNGVIEELNLDSNTFVNIRSYTISGGKCSPLGLFYVKYIGTSTSGADKEVISSGAKIVINNNIYYSDLGATTKITSMFIRYNIKQIAGDIAISNNIAYVNDTDGEFKYFYTSGTTNILPEGNINNKYDDMKQEGIFDTTQGAVYNFETFEFKPATQFASYGAQR